MSCEKTCALAWRMNKQRVPGGGRKYIRGLAANREIADKEVITEFHQSGIFATNAKAKEGDKYYAVQISKKKFARLTKIDGRVNLETGYDNKVGNLCNHQARSYANAKMIIHSTEEKISLRAEKLIKTGESIFYDYGNPEWTGGFRGEKRSNRRMHPNLKQGKKPPLKKRKAKTTAPAAASPP
jgi:SET domain-containing protein